MKNKLFISLALLLGLLGGGVALSARTQALSGGEFQAGRIIDDAVFFNPQGMTQGQIQDFLNAKVPSCDTNGTKPYGGTTRAAYSASRGYSPPFICLRDYRQDTPSKSAEDGLCSGFSAGNKSAAEIIYEVSQSCGINPKVLLVLLQKEQSLVSDDWPWPTQYRSATGYGCPDTAPCDAEYYGFFNQVYMAGRQFKRYARNQSSYNYRVNRNNYIQYNPNASCGGTNVFIQNQATAGLYNYTPYQPNQSALDNLYGSGDSCGAYGNRNFWRMFNDWFGSTFSNRPLLTNTSHPDGTLVREAGRSEIYLIQGQERHHVQDLSVFASHNFAWERVREATLKDMTLTIDSSPITYRSGTLVRGNTDPKIFYLRCSLTACTKHHVGSLEVFNELGFKSWQVYIVDQAKVNAMTSGAAISTSTVHPQDSLINDPATNKIYIIGNGARHWIPSLNTFSAHHLNWGLVRPATAGDLALPESSALPYPEGVLVRASDQPNTYAIDADDVGNLSKRHLVSQTVFAGLGYSPPDIYVDTAAVLPAPNGPNITE